MINNELPSEERPLETEEANILLFNEDYNKFIESAEKGDSAQMEALLENIEDLFKKIRRDYNSSTEETTQKTLKGEYDNLLEDSDLKGIITEEILELMEQINNGDKYGMEESIIKLNDIIKEKRAVCYEKETTRFIELIKKDDKGNMKKAWMPLARKFLGKLKDVDPMKGLAIERELDKL